MNIKQQIPIKIKSRKNFNLNYRISEVNLTVYSAFDPQTVNSVAFLVLLITVDNRELHLVFKLKLAQIQGEHSGTFSL